MSVIVKNISKTFKLSTKQMKINKTTNNLLLAVDGISFTAYPGEVFGLLGPNGAGKTTTLRMIATLIKNDQGEIYINDESIENFISVRKNIGFLTNDIRIEEQMTPNYAFEYFGRFYKMTPEEISERKKYLFQKFGVEKFQEVKVGDLSTGMKQKVSICCSLVHNPNIIIFDEPTNGLDVLTAKVVTDYLIELAREGKTVIMSTHIMNLAQKICDRVGIIINGKMVENDLINSILEKHHTNDLEEVFFDLYKQEVGE